MKIQFKVKMQPKYMYNFLMNHIYKSFTGLFSILIGVASIIMGFYSWKNGGSAYVICYVAVALLALVYPPVMLWFKAKQQVTLSPVFKEIIRYELDHEGVHVVQGEKEAFGKWEEFYKVTSTRKSLIVYRDKKQAMIWPKECLGDQYDKVVELIRKEVPAPKLKMR